MAQPDRKEAINAVIEKLTEIVAHTRSTASTINTEVASPVISKKSNRLSSPGRQTRASAVVNLRSRDSTGPSPTPNVCVVVVSQNSDEVDSKLITTTAKDSLQDRDFIEQIQVPNNIIIEGKEETVISSDGDSKAYSAELFSDSKDNTEVLVSIPAGVNVGNLDTKNNGNIIVALKNALKKTNADQNKSTLGNCGQRDIWKCAKCNYQSHNKHYLKQHVDLVHNAERPFKCPFCDYAGKRSHSLKEHLVVHSTNRPYECSLCNASFRKKGHLTNHVRMHAAQKILECNLCQEKYTERHLLYQHLRTEHEGEDIYPCEVCSYATTVKSNIIMHMHTHGNPKSFKCDVCSFTALHMNILKQHLKTHGTDATYHVETTNLKPRPVILLKCSECGFTTDNKDVLKDHMWIHVDNKDLEKAEAGEEDKSNVKAEQRMLPKLTTSGDGDEAVYVCPDCKFTCKEAYAYITHMLQHKPRYPVNPAFQKKEEQVQGKTESQIQVENRYGFTHDVNVGMYRCLICGYVCEHQRTIKAHIWKHSGHKDIDYPMFQNGPLSMYDDTPLGIPALRGSNAGESTLKIIDFYGTNPTDETQQASQDLVKNMTVVSKESSSGGDSMPLIQLLQTKRPSQVPDCQTHDVKDKQQIVFADVHTPSLQNPGSGIENNIGATYNVEHQESEDTQNISEADINLIQSQSQQNPTELVNDIPVPEAGQVCEIEEESVVHYVEITPKEQNRAIEIEVVKESDHSILDLSQRNQSEYRPQFVVKPSGGETPKHENSELVQLVLRKSPRLASKSQDSLHIHKDILSFGSKKLFKSEQTKSLQETVTLEKEPKKLSRNDIAFVGKKRKAILQEDVDDKSKSKKVCFPCDVNIEKNVVVQTMAQVYTTPSFSLQDSRGNSPRAQSPRCPEIVMSQTDVGLHTQIMKSSGTQSMTEVMVTPATNPEPISSTKVSTNDLVQRLEAENSTEEQMVTLLSLLKKGPNRNPACPVQIERSPESESDNESKSSATESQGGVEDKQPKTGICSSLLAVIEQLRERSKSESDVEDGGTDSGSKSSSKSAKKRSRKIQAIEDKTPIEEYKNVEKIEDDGSYRCKLCHYGSSSTALMKTHMRLHKTKKPFECSLCDYLASSSESLQSHMLQHCKVRTYHCKLCPSQFNYKSQLRAHMRAHNEKDPFICDKCDYETSNAAAFRYHMRFHSDQKSDKCVLCDEPYSDLEEHKQNCKVSSYTCDDCSFTSSDAEVYKKHVKSAHPKVFKCTQCYFISATAGGMRNHCRTHCEEAKPLQCDLCDFVAMSSRSLKSHMKRHVNDQRFVQQPLEQYKCNLCGYVCHHLPSLKSHMWRHASDKNYSYQSTNDVINAAIDFNTLKPTEEASSATTSTEATTEQFVETFEASEGSPEEPLVTFRCCQCGFETVHKSQLNEHMKSHMDIIKRTLEVNKARFMTNKSDVTSQGKEIAESQRIETVQDDNMEEI